jgi:ParB family transcriptional regulator, chromosome partitioning protein
VTATALSHAAGLEERPVGALHASPTNPRKFYDAEALAQLAASIKAKGVEQPLIVRHRADGQLEVIHGERRLRAAKLAGLEVVPVIVRELADAQVVEAQLAEMGQARDISPLEKARAFQAYMRAARFTQAQLAGRLGLSEPVVSETLALLDLPDAARVLFDDARMTASHGRELLRLKGHPARLKRLVHDVGSALKGEGVYSAKRLRSEVARELQMDATEAKWNAEEAKRAEAAKRAAAQAKAGKGVKLTPAELKAKAARRAELRLARQRNLDIVARAPALARQVVAEGRRWKLPPDLLTKVAAELHLGAALRWAAGATALKWDTAERVAVAVVAKLPGRWRKGPVTLSQLGARPPLDAAAARNWLGLWSWLALRTGGLEASLTAAGRKRVAQLVTAKGRKPAKPAKRARGRGK